MMKQPRAADDFAAIRARMEELEREKERAVRKPDGEPAARRRRQITEELEAQVIPRRN
jgi:hypothetical protein